MSVIKILVANPNRSQELLDQLMGSARKKVCDPNTELIPFRNPIGSTHLDSYFADRQAVWSFIRALLDEVKRVKADGVVIAGFGDFGLFALREALDIPVLSIAECSQTLACMLGHRYSVVTVLKRNIPYQEDLVRLFGLSEKCASVRGVDINIASWTFDPAVFEDLKKEISLILEQDGAEVIVLGGARFSVYADQLEQDLGVPVLDPVLVTVKQAEMMIEAGLCHSKKNKFALPPQPLDDYFYMGNSSSEKGW